MRLRVGLAFPAVWAFAALLTARTTSTEAPGLVTDSSGAAVPGASVAIKRLSTGEERRSTTNETGEYTFPLIETGDYRVRVEKSGFKSATLPRLHVELRQKARMDFTIELGQLSEMVEAGASSVALRTEDAAAGQVIDNRRVVELPLNGRDVQSLAALAPGVQFGLRAGPFAFRRVSCNIAARPDLCHFGGAGRNILASPGQRNLDGALFKNFSLSERAWLQFPPEFFNVFNTPYFGQPNGVSFQTITSTVSGGPRDGEIRSLRTPMRINQFGLKLRFQETFSCSTADGFFRPN